MSDEDECPLCGGCGEVEATTQKMERDTFGCPLCISAELRAEIERHIREKVALAGLVAKERAENERLQEKVCNRDRLIVMHKEFEESQKAWIERLEAENADLLKFRDDLVELLRAVNPCGRATLAGKEGAGQ